MGSYIVGMSGGVDSSVAALLLKQQGHNVSGVIFKQVNDPDKKEDSVCCSASAVEEAREVAHQIGIHLYEADLRKVFKEQVIDPTIKSFEVGATPSPCLTCNGKVRSLYLDQYRWLVQGDFFVTGHYMKVQDGRVYRGIDKRKDQSYMMALVPAKQLLFWNTPLGDLTKQQVREIADEHELVTAHNPDSQDLCFNHLLPKYKRDVSYRDKVIDNYSGRPTPGQKRGFGGKVVLRVLPDTVEVGDAPPLSRQTNLFNINLHCSNLPKTFEVQIGSHAPVVPGRLDSNKLILDQEMVLVPGQIAAFYQGDLLLGGGVIT